MLETMTVRPEVWPVAADEASLWLLSGDDAWRPDGPSVILTYMAVVSVRGFARDRWPRALPVTPEFAAAVGRPPTHGAADVPVPRFCDVLLHGLRHLAWLLDHDAETSAAMGEAWRRHLEPFAPALAGMYSERHAPAA